MNLFYEDILCINFISAICYAHLYEKHSSKCGIGHFHNNFNKKSKNTIKQHNNTKKILDQVPFQR